MAIQPYRPLELMENKDITKYEFKDFIGVWDNFVPKAFCDELIEMFDNIYDTQGCFLSPTDESLAGLEQDDIMRSSDAYGGAMNRKDYAILLNYVDQLKTYRVHQFLKSCALHYRQEYAQLRTTSIVSTDVKIQKTPPGGGYHLWHYENGNIEHAMRELTWMIYLNDIPDGEGETEFMYQRRRIKPTAGTVVIWPAAFTHVHKGNTVLTTDKYILTGWYIKNK